MLPGKRCDRFFLPSGTILNASVRNGRLLLLSTFPSIGAAAVLVWLDDTHGRSSFFVLYLYLASSLQLPLPISFLCRHSCWLHNARPFFTPFQTSSSFLTILALFCCPAEFCASLCSPSPPPDCQRQTRLYIDRNSVYIDISDVFSPLPHTQFSFLPWKEPIHLNSPSPLLLHLLLTHTLLHS